MTDLTVKDIEREFASLSTCCLHQPTWTAVDVERVLCAIQKGYGDWSDMPEGGKDVGSDSESYVVVLLKNGRYGLFNESEDYTGHGCTCNAYTEDFATLDELLDKGVIGDARDAVRARLGGAS